MARHSLVRSSVIIVIAALFWSTATPVYPLTVENIPFADSLTIGTAQVSLHNAALLRYLRFIKAYAVFSFSGSGLPGVSSPLPGAPTGSC